MGMTLNGEERRTDCPSDTAGQNRRLDRLLLGRGKTPKKATLYYFAELVIKIIEIWAANTKSGTKESSQKKF